MMGDPNYLRRSTFLWINAALAVGYFLLAAILNGQTAIEIFNAVLFGLSLGVVVAYAVPAWEAIRKPLLSGPDILKIGICMSWGAADFARVISIAWRLNGKPVEWLDSWLWGLYIPGLCMAGLSHIISPEALEGRIPTTAMRTWGFRTVAIATCTMLIVVRVFDPS